MSRVSKLFKKFGSWFKRLVPSAAVIAACTAICLMLMGFASDYSRKVDSHVTSKVVRIIGDNGMCSGEQVKTAMGKSYVLTAAHCKELKIGLFGVYRVEDANKRMHFLKVIAEDPNSDLLLLEGLPNVEGLNIAERSPPAFREIHTYTHGRNLDTYKTSGTIIEDKAVPVIMFDIAVEADEARCKEMPKLMVLESMWGGKACVMFVPLTFSTAFVAPGSSGGAVVNEDGELIGVVSAGGQGFGLFVRLQDIKAFLSAY